MLSEKRVILGGWRRNLTDKEFYCFIALCVRVLLNPRLILWELLTGLLLIPFTKAAIRFNLLPHRADWDDFCVGTSCLRDGFSLLTFQIPSLNKQTFHLLFISDDFSYSTAQIQPCYVFLPMPVCVFMSVGKHFHGLDLKNVAQYILCSVMWNTPASSIKW